MLSLKSAELAIAMLTFFLAYLVVVTVAGSISAWVSQKMEILQPLMQAF